jgi:hypothetical protein
MMALYTHKTADQICHKNIQIGGIGGRSCGQKFPEKVDFDTIDEIIDHGFVGNVGPIKTVDEVSEIGMLKELGLRGIRRIELNLRESGRKKGMALGKVDGKMQLDGTVDEFQDRSMGEIIFPKEIPEQRRGTGHWNSADEKGTEVPEGATH